MTTHDILPRADAAHSSLAIEKKVQSTRLKLLFDQLPQGLVATLINASLLTYIICDVDNTNAPLVWLASMVAMCIIRACMFARFRSASVKGADYATWTKLFAAGAIATAAVWGTAGIALFPSNSYQHQAFIGFVLAGMAAGASGSMASNDKIFRIYLWLTIAPYTMRLLVEGSPLNVAMAAMSFVFIIAMGMSARRNAQVTQEALRLRFVNDALAHDLEHTIESQQRTNLALHDEVAEHEKTMASLETAVHEAQASVRAKSQFLANMSHEIRTPMNGVFGMTDLLMRTELDSRQKKLVGTINESAKSLLTIINDILDLSRIEAGKFELDAHEFNLRDLMERAVELFASQAHKKGLEISLFIDPAVPMFAKGDSGRIKQIMLNLIGNALKFTRYGEIGVRVTLLSRELDATRVCITITDTGIGIDRAVLDQLFQPFAQAETSISRRFGGTGLGLAIARHLAELMGGTVTLESQLGRGTEARIEITLADGVMSSIEAHSDISVLDGARIIVIDDRETNREIVSSYLEGSSARVECAASTAAAWPMLIAASDANKPFHAAVVDMVMPDENGLEFAARIKGHPTLGRLKIIIATSLNWQGDLVAIREAGVEAVLTKPVRRADLVDAAARAVQGTRHAGWRANRSSDLQSQGAPDQYSQTRRPLSGNVLVAEDNLVNVEVAKEYLASFGCHVSIVYNGLEAVAAVESAKYDVVFMDCQMPIMDGLTATRRIRSLEAENGRPATVIIALTANAFAEDRERCLDAGMDGYLSKPYSEDQIYDLLQKHLNPSKANAQAALPAEVAAADEPVSPAQPPVIGTPVLDEGIIGPLRKSRPDLLGRIIKTYLAHAPVALADLTDAAHAGDCERMSRQAHSLKSSSANLGASELSAKCRELEVSANAAEIAVSRRLATEITQSFAALQRVLEDEYTRLPLAAAGVAVDKPTRAAG